MEIRWLTAFLDLPPARFEAGIDFWRSVTGSGLSAPRGEDGQFATLLPTTGDPYLRVQRLGLAEPRIHLDLHVDSVADGAEEAEALGAELVSLAGHAVLRSPGGFTFCLVADDGSAVRPDPRPDPEPHLIDQVCLDVAADRFESELGFWSALTGWEARASRLEEFVALERPPGQPLRLLVQRLGADDPGPAVRAHLDLACGSNLATIAEFHRSLGAVPGHAGVIWRTMTDPAGMVYCVTGRDPRTGVPPVG